MALIDKETIRKEIERRCVCENTEINRKRLNRVIIESSKRWQPVEGLEEAARHSEILTYPMPEDGDIEKVMKAQEARIFHEIGFKAGAEWQRKQDQSLIELAEDHAMLAGMNKMEQQMMEGAVEGKIIKSYNPVINADGPSLHGIELIYSDEGKPYLLAGDKVHIIVIKEDEK